MENKYLSRKEELILIAIRNLGENAYGLSVFDELVDRTGKNWLFGSIYTPLRQLYDKGLIDKTERESIPDERGGRPRVYFSVTPKGEKALEKIRELNTALWTDVPPLINE